MSKPKLSDSQLVILSTAARAERAIGREDLKKLKAKGDALTRALSRDLAPEVRINCVCPGYVDTDMVRRDWIDKTEDPAATLHDEVEAFAPMGRIGKPEEIAGAILYLASDQAGFVTGAALSIDGGATASHQI